MRTRALSALAALVLLAGLLVLFGDNRQAAQGWQGLPTLEGHHAGAEIIGGGAP